MLVTPRRHHLDDAVAEPARTDPRGLGDHLAAAGMTSRGIKDAVNFLVTRRAL
jgi:hypothetical protein